MIGMVDAWKDSLIVCFMRISRASERFALAHELLALAAADDRSPGTYRADIYSTAREIRERKLADK